MKSLDEMIEYVCTDQEYINWFRYDGAQAVVLLSKVYSEETSVVSIAIASRKRMIAENKQIQQRLDNQLANEARRQANLKKLQTQ